MTGDAELAALISDEIAATLNPELHHFDLRELWPGVAPERGMPLILADFARHRGSFFYPVMIFEAERRNRPELARLALESLYAGVVEGRSAGRLQAVLSFAALKGADKDRSESEWVDDARRLLWQAAADTLLNGDFALSPDYWHHWRPIATKSLSHHTNWQAVRMEMATLDADVRKSGVRSLRLNLLPVHGRDLVKLDTHRFRLEPGGHVLRGWLRWDEGGTPPRIDIEMRDLDGGFETVRLDETGTLEPPDAEGWRRMRMEFHVRQRTVANLFIYAQIRESAASGHLWLDGFHLEPGIS